MICCLGDPVSGVAYHDSVLAVVRGRSFRRGTEYPRAASFGHRDRCALSRNVETGGNWKRWLSQRRFSLEDPQVTRIKYKSSKLLAGPSGRDAAFQTRAYSSQSTTRKEQRPITIRYRPKNVVDEKEVSQESGQAFGESTTSASSTSSPAALPDELPSGELLRAKLQDYKRAGKERAACQAAVLSLRGHSAKGGEQARGGGGEGFSAALESVLSVGLPPRALLGAGLKDVVAELCRDLLAERQVAACVRVLKRLRAAGFPPSELAEGSVHSALAESWGGLVRRGQVAGSCKLLDGLAEAGINTRKIVRECDTRDLEDACLALLQRKRVHECVTFMLALDEAEVRVQRLVQPMLVAQKCIAAGGVSLALRYTDALPPLSGSYNAVIRACGSLRDLAGAFAVLPAMDARRVQPDMHTWRALIDACGRCGARQDATAVFEGLLERGAVPNVYVFNSFMNVHAADPDMVWEIYAILQAKGVVADATTYNVLLKACSLGGRADVALALYSDLKEWAAAGGTPLDVITYSTIIQIFSKAKMWEAALEVKAEMEAAGVPPNLVTWTSLVKACAAAGLVEQAFRVFEDMRAAGCRPNTDTYNVLIDACAEAGQEARAFALLDQMRAGGGAPASSSPPIDAGGAAVRGGDSLLQLDTLPLKDGGLAGQPAAGAGLATSLGPMPGGAMPRAVRDGLPAVGTGGVEAVREDQVGRGGSEAPASSGAAAEQRAPPRGAGPRRQPPAPAHAPSSGGRSASLRMTKKRQLNSDVAALDLLSTSGAPPPGPASSSGPARSNSSSGSRSGSGSGWPFTPASSDPPGHAAHSSSSSSSAASPDYVDPRGGAERGRTGPPAAEAVVGNGPGVGQTGQQPAEEQGQGQAQEQEGEQERAAREREQEREERLRELSKGSRSIRGRHTCEPDAVTYNSLMKACGASPQRARAVMAAMEARGIRPNARSWSTLIDAFGSVGDARSASQVFEEMKAAGILPDIIAYTALIKAHVQGGLMDEAYALFEQLKAAGLRPNVVTYNTLLRQRSSGGQLKDVQRALALYEEMRAAGYAPNDVLLKSLLEDWAEGAIDGGNAHSRRASPSSSTATTSSTSTSSSNSSSRKCGDGDRDREEEEEEEEEATLPDFMRHLVHKVAHSTHARAPPGTGPGSTSGAGSDSADLLSIDLHGLSQAEARTVVLSVLRILKERHLEGLPVEADLVISTGGGMGKQRRAQQAAATRDAVVHVLKAELGLPVLASFTSPSRAPPPAPLPPVGGGAPQWYEFDWENLIPGGVPAASGPGRQGRGEAAAPSRKGRREEKEEQEQEEGGVEVERSLQAPAGGGEASGAAAAAVAAAAAGAGKPRGRRGLSEPALALKKPSDAGRLIVTKESLTAWLNRKRGA
eukprot:jgi/Mesen1/1993/ME000147S01090